MRAREGIKNVKRAERGDHPAQTARARLPGSTTGSIITTKEKLLLEVADDAIKYMGQVPVFFWRFCIIKLRHLSVQKMCIKISYP